MLTQDRDIALIKAAVERGVEAAREDAGYGGRMDDGGASLMQSRLTHWLDGVMFARSGKTVVYDHIIANARKQDDPDYAEYIRLQKKFESI